MRHIPSVRLRFVVACIAALASLAVTKVAAADDLLPLSAVPQGTPVSPETLEPLAPPLARGPVPAANATTPPAPAPAPPPSAIAPSPATGAPDADHPADGSRAASAVLQPWDVDVRGALHTTPILQYGGIGASADAGMRRIGPGTFALGGGFDYFVCGTTCSSTPLSFTQRQLSFEGRATYHMGLPKVGGLDFYPLLTAGFIVSRSSLTVGDSSEYRASDVAPSIGFGAGASYFFAGRFFVGAEARFRYAAGTYSYELASGPARPFDRGGVDTWSASTVDLSVAIGARF